MPGTIICYGDSNTYGFDPSSIMAGRYSYWKRWTGILKEKTGVIIRNHGVNGRCIPHTASQIKFACEQLNDWILEEEPVWLWIMLGTNDLLEEKRFGAEETANRMKEFLSILREEPPVRDGKIRLRLISPPYMEYGAWVNEDRLYQESRRLGVAYQKIAEELQIDFTCTDDWGIDVVFDGVHFSVKGHAKFAKMIANTAKKDVFDEKT